MGIYILDHMLDNWRAQAIQKMCKSYKPQVSVDFVLQTLAFIGETSENEDAAIGIAFMRKLGCLLEEDLSKESVVPAHGKHQHAHKKNSGKGHSSNYNNPNHTTTGLIWNTKDSVIDPTAWQTQANLLL